MITGQEYIDQQMNVYSDAFDFYMECGKMPETLQKGDVLGAYIQSVFEDNPQIDSQDELWKEVLKDNLMSFLNILLQMFVPIEQSYLSNLQMIEEFQKSDIDKKQEMWVQVYSQIKQNFSEQEVNIDNFIKQINSENREVVLEALIEEWKNANECQHVSKKESILRKYKTKFENHVRECGRSDYKEKKHIQSIYYHYPVLKEIVKVIGREQLPNSNRLLDDIIFKYIPVLPNQPLSIAEREEITIGNNLNFIIPIEMTYLADKETESLFFHRFAEHQLQQFSNRPPLISQLKKEQLHISKPRLEKGPIIVSLDTSGSMSGMPERLALSLLTQLVQIARKEKRNCFLITFSIRSTAIDLSTMYNWNQFKEFLSNRFTGGTDGESMLNKALGALVKGKFMMADILIISDFMFPLPLEKTVKRIEEAKKQGTRFYGLAMGHAYKDYNKILDKIWSI
jgi:uncharacterized protein with von Willebrand factor type A (vWA) domain